MREKTPSSSAPAPGRHIEFLGQLLKQLALASSTTWSVSQPPHVHAQVAAAAAAQMRDALSTQAELVPVLCSGRHVERLRVTVDAGDLHF